MIRERERERKRDREKQRERERNVANNEIIIVTNNEKQRKNICRFLKFQDHFPSDSRREKENGENNERDVLRTERISRKKTKKKKKWDKSIHLSSKNHLFQRINIL